MMPIADHILRAVYELYDRLKIIPIASYCRQQRPGGSSGVRPFVVVASPELNEATRQVINFNDRLDEKE